MINYILLRACTFSTECFMAHLHMVSCGIWHIYIVYVTCTMFSNNKKYFQISFSFVWRAKKRFYFRFMFKKNTTYIWLVQWIVITIYFIWKWKRKKNKRKKVYLTVVNYCMLVIEQIVLTTMDITIPCQISFGVCPFLCKTCIWFSKCGIVILLKSIILIDHTW